MSADEETWNGEPAPHAIAEYLNTAPVGFRLRIKAADWNGLQQPHHASSWDAIKGFLWGSTHGAFALTMADGLAIIEKRSNLT